MQRATTIIAAIMLSVALTGCAKPPESPTATDPVRQAAFANTAEAIENVFGETIAPARMSYVTEADRALVYVDAGENFSYCAQTDKLSGAVRHIGINYAHIALTEAQRLQAEEYTAEWHRLFNDTQKHHDEMEALSKRLVDDCTPVATDLIMRAYAGGRTVAETMNGFTISDNTMEPTQMVGISVRMHEGECYTVTVLWPQLTVADFSFYPLGWHSCVFGYDDPAKASQYPPLEEEPAPVPTMTPEPAGDGGEVSPVIGITALPDDAKIYATTFSPEESARTALSPQDCLAITELLGGKELLAATPACDSDILLETENARFRICSACGSVSTGINGATGSAALSEAEVGTLCDLLQRYDLLSVDRNDGAEG